MFFKENVLNVFLHVSFVANPHVSEAAVYIHPVSHSLGLALVKESFLPGKQNAILNHRPKGLFLLFIYLFSGDCFVTNVQFHLLEQLVNITPSENVKPFLFLFSEIHLFLEI